MRLSPIAAVVAACILTLTACGDDAPDPESSDSNESASTSPSDGPAQRKDLSKPRKTKKPKPPDLGEATICETLDAEAVGDVVGAALEVGEVQNNACVFADPKNPSLTYVGVSQVAAEASDGESGMVAGLQGQVAGEPEELAEVGDLAFTVVGTTPGGRPAAAGAVMVDDTVVSVGFPLAEGVSPDDGKEQVIELLELVTESL